MIDAETVTVVTDALRKEATKWRGLSDDLDKVRATTAGLHLEPTAFVIGDYLLVSHAGPYKVFHDLMTSLFTAGAAEFDQVGDALDRAADRFDSTDGHSAADIKNIYG